MGDQGGRRVLRLVTRLNVGGPARHALLLTHGLRHDFPTVLAAGQSAASEGTLAHPDVPVRQVPLVRPPHPVLDVRALCATRRLLRQHRIDLLHTHMAKAGAVGRLAARTVSPRPVTVHTFHGHVLEGYFSSGSQQAFIQAERWLAGHCDVLIAVSPEIKDALLDLGIGRPDRFRVIPLGLDLDRFLQVDRPSGVLRRHLGVDPQTALIGIAGRLVPIKDHATLLAAVARLDEVHLAVLGDGELRSSLEHQARTLGIAHRVHFTGWWDDMPAALSDLDLVTLTSLNEGTPVALIEALATGRAVVATDVGGVRSVVTHGHTGRLVPPRDPDALTSSVAGLLGQPAERAALGSAGRTSVARRFGKDRLVEDIRALYEDLLTRPSITPLGAPGG